MFDAKYDAYLHECACLIAPWYRSHVGMHPFSSRDGSRERKSRGLRQLVAFNDFLEREICLEECQNSDASAAICFCGSVEMQPDPFQREKNLLL